MAMAETSTVPVTSGRTPNRGVAKRGVHSVPNRKSVMGTSRRNANVSTASTTMMPAVVPIESRAQRNSAHSIRNSNRFISGSLGDARAEPELVEGSFFAGEESFERHADLGTPLAERRSDLAVGEMLPGELVDLRREFDIADFLHEIRSAEEHFYELLNLGTVGCLPRHVDEERT